MENNEAIKRGEGWWGVGGSSVSLKGEVGGGEGEVINAGTSD